MLVLVLCRTTQHEHWMLYKQMQPGRWGVRTYEQASCNIQYNKKWFSLAACVLGLQTAISDTITDDSPHVTPLCDTIEMILRKGLKSKCYLPSLAI